MRNLLRQNTRISRWRFGTRSAYNFRERVVHIGQQQGAADAAAEDFEDSNQSDEAQQVEFVDNRIKSSKYTILTFLPR